MICHTGQANNTAIIKKPKISLDYNIKYIYSSLDHCKFAEDFALSLHSKTQAGRPTPMWKSDHHEEGKQHGILCVY